MPRKPEQINPAEEEFDYEKSAEQVPSDIQNKAESALEEVRQVQRVEDMKEEDIEEMMRVAERVRPDTRTKAETVIKKEKAEKIGTKLEEAAKNINPRFEQGFNLAKQEDSKKEDSLKESEVEIKKTLENLSSDIPGVDELKKEFKAEAVRKEEKEVLGKIENFAKTEKEKEGRQKEEGLKKEIKNQLIVIKRSAESDSGKLAECRRMEEEVEKDPLAVAYEIISDALIAQEKETGSLSKDSELAKLRTRDRLAAAIKLAEILTGRDFQKEAETKTEDKFKNISEKEYTSAKSVFNKKMDIKKAEGTDVDEDILKNRYGWTTEVVKGILSRKLIYRNKKGEVVGELKINIFGQVVDRVALTKQCLDKEIEKELKAEFGNRQQNKEGEIIQYKEQELKKILEERPQINIFKELPAEQIPKPVLEEKSSSGESFKGRTTEFLNGVDFTDLGSKIDEEVTKRLKEADEIVKKEANITPPVKKSGFFSSGKATSN